MPAPKDIARPVITIVSGYHTATSHRIRGDTTIDTGVSQTFTIL